MADRLMASALEHPLARIIDFAGMFPPASLSLDAAAAAFSDYRAGTDRWALGRFVIKAAEIPRLCEWLSRSGAGQRPSDRWPVAALIGHETARDLDIVSRAIAESDGVVGHVRVEGVELTSPDAGRFGRRAPGLPASVETFVEVTLGPDCDAHLDAVQASGSFAKVRTGGVVAQAIPTASDLARFVRDCCRRRLPFKATAGLHHPIRGDYPLTYEPGAPCATMHGFMNLLAATALALETDADESALVAVLSGHADIRLEPSQTALAWQSRSVTVSSLAGARACFRSFGSCSFEEPLNDLRVRGLL